MRRALVVAALLVISTACALSRTTAGRAACEPAKLASSWLTAGPVFRECEVDRQATEAEPKVRPAWKPTSFNYCNWSVVDFVVDTNGKPEPRSGRLVSSNEPGLGVVHLKSVEAKRFQAAEKDGRRVRQVVREPMVFIMNVKNTPPSARDTSCHP